MENIDASSLYGLDIDILIDARSPKEYAHSHIPTALNFYALNDKEYEEVGTIYVNKSKHQAKILGASYICNNASLHLLELHKILKPAAKIGIYCARGGMRSKSLGIIFEQVGFRVYRINSGYKGYRNEVINFLEKTPQTHFITLFGNTGSGKTKLIHRLSPSIDLEGLANHLGSSFGNVRGIQPSGKAFENNLYAKLQSIQNHKTCFIEGESRRIGNLSLPKPLYEAMQQGTNVLITSSMEKRVDRILEDYGMIDSEFFYTSINKIKKYIKKSILQEIIDSFSKDDLKKVAFLLLEHYYDKVYKQPTKVDITINSDDISKALEQLQKLSYM